MFCVGVYHFGDYKDFCFCKLFIAHYLDRSNLLGGRRREENMSVCLFVYMYVYVLMYQMY